MKQITVIVYRREKSELKEKERQSPQIKILKFIY